MAANRGDTYIIDKDQRDNGGVLETISTFDSWDAAKQAWEATPVDINPNIQFWFARVQKNGNIDTLDCKCR